MLFIGVSNTQTAMPTVNGGSSLKIGRLLFSSRIWQALCW